VKQAIKLAESVLADRAKGEHPRPRRAAATVEATNLTGITQAAETVRLGIAAERWRAVDSVADEHTRAASMP
jgi:hypothetical protein